MKKLIITLAIVLLPATIQAATVQDQYISALKQLIFLLEQQVNMLIVELNSLPNRVQIPTISLDPLPVYNVPMDPNNITPNPVVNLEPSAEAVSDPVLLTPHVEVVAVSTNLQKNGPKQMALELKISNIDDNLLLPLSPVTASTNIPKWVPEVSVSYKNSDTSSGPFKFIKNGEYFPVRVLINNLPDTEGQVTITVNSWKFSGEFTGEIKTTPDLPLSTTIEIR